MVDGDAPGVRFRHDSVLVEKAIALLRDGPKRSEAIAKRVLGIRGGPPAVTERLVCELLRAEPAARLEDGEWTLGSGRPPEQVGFDRVRFAVVDVETTGGVAGRDGRIIEIAIVRVENRQIVDVFSSLVDPGVRVSPWITRLTGIGTPMVRGAPPFRDLVPEVRERLDGRVFVAHSAGYDWGFIRAELRSLGAVVPRGSKLCTVQLVRRLLPGLDRRGLDAVADYYGIEIEGRHRARGDAVATARILLRLLDEAERKGLATWPELRRELRAFGRRRKKRSTGMPAGGNGDDAC